MRQGMIWVSKQEEVRIKNSKLEIQIYRLLRGQALT